MPENNLSGDDTGNSLLPRLLEFVQAAGAEVSLDQTLRRCVEGAARLLDTDAAVIVLLKEDGTDLELASYGADLAGLEQPTLTLAQPTELAGIAAANGSPILSNNLLKDMELNNLGQLRRGLAVPLLWPSVPLGGLAVYRSDVRPPFTTQNQNLLEQLGLLLSPLLGQARRAEMLQQAVQARDDFISVASHDLRNPLSSMRGFTQLITRLIDKTKADQPLPRERIQNYLVRIVRQTDNLNEMIEKILDFSRILSRRLELTTETVDLKDITGAIALRFQQWLEDQEKDFEPEKRHILQFTAHPEKILLDFDRARLAQIITSLVHNAIKYSPEGGLVLVSLQEQSKLATLTVQDSGTGIPPEKQPSVFQRWKVSEVSREAGLGVSLFIAATVIERYGGQLTFNTAPGAGTIFTLTVPVKA